MIVYYSGTGNSACVAQEMARLLDDKTLAVSKLTPTKFSLQEGETLGLVFPVHSWGIPKRMLAFIRQMEVENLTRETVVYAIATCGDDAGLTNAQLKHELLKKGIVLKHVYAVRMPNTYILFPGFDVDAESLRNQKIAETMAVLPTLAEAIKSNQPADYYVKTDKSWLKSKVIYPLFMRFMMDDKPFYTTDACIGCGLCAQQCGEGNITLENGRPTWHGGCTQCLGCINRCPKQAIEYGKKSLGKGRSHMNPQPAEK